ncbi:MAG TPA: DUF3352 domain-containing protein [Pyrinomonadaceae bacterium]|nr:DUF3352 domain-containing protein [Pyrinomonadaceae bacterium]
MPTTKNFRRVLATLLALIIFAAPVLAQRRPAATPKRPAPQAPEKGPSFDSLLAADTYKVYCEVRGVGGLVHSPAVTDLLEPLLKLGKPPKEIQSVVKWLNAHADVLGGSRLMIAGWPSRQNVPTVLLAVEFASAEDAKKFYPELRDFIPTLLPTPTPTPTPGASPSPSLTVVGVRNNEPAAPYEVKVLPTQEGGAAPAENAPAAPPYYMSQAGSLVFLTDKAFKVGDLKPKNSKPLEEDQNFTLARSRFASESVFLYFDLKSIQKEEEEQRAKWDEERKRIEEEAAKNPQPEETAEMPESSEELPDPGSMEDEARASDEEMPSPSPEIVDPNEPPPTGTLSSAPPPSPVAGFNWLNLLFGGVGGPTVYPEAIGAALVFEGDSYVARVLTLDGSDKPGNSIPFLPQFASGPALVPASPGVLPADADLFVTASVDYVQIYDRVLPIMSVMASMNPDSTQPTNEKPPQSPFAEIEGKLGMKLRSDLLPLLGNEVAMAMLKPTKETEDAAKRSAQPTTAGPQQTETAVASPNPVFAISIKDREAVAKVIPKLIEALGLKGASAFAQTEKRGSAEIVSYAGVFAYAFIDNFLIISPDAKDTQRVVDAYVNNQTLSSNSQFRNFTRWQSRQVLGQVYVAPGLVEQYTLGNPAPGHKLNEFLSRMNPVIDPLTYSLTNDGVGHLHELHVPKNLLQLIVAAASSELGEEPARANEAMAQSALRTVFSAEATFQATEGNGSYGSLEQLIAANFIPKDMAGRSGYRIELTVAGSKFMATAVPSDYGVSGKLSYFIDETGVLRAGDHGGGAATASDQPLN